MGCLHYGEGLGLNRDRLVPRAADFGEFDGLGCLQFKSYLMEEIVFYNVIVKVIYYAFVVLFYRGAIQSYGNVLK